MHLISTILGRYLPPYVLNQLRFEWHVWRNTRHASSQRKALNGRDNLYVNIGAGDSGRDGWVNIDAYPQPGINCLWDCRKGLPFQPGSVKGLFAEHVFEHLDYVSEVPVFLAEAFRTLQQGGTIRLIVPDARKYLVGYMSDDWSDLVKTRPLLPGNCDPFSRRRFDTKMELINEVFRQGTEHKFAWDLETMMLVMGRVGFTEIRQCEVGVGRDPHLVLDSPNRAPESLYVEATKPRDATS